MAEAKYKNMWNMLIESNYGDAADIDSDMRCTICTRILINAHNSVCGCRYCLECVKPYLNGESRFCPGNTDDCKEEELVINSNIYPDHAMNYRISKLNVACRYSCGYRCELRNMDKHERTCQRQPVICPYVNVGCRETRLVTDRINDHLVGENESHARLLMTCIDMLEGKITSLEKSDNKIDEARSRETNDILRKENQLTKEENISLKAEIEKHAQQLSEMDTRIQTQAREMELLTEKYSRSEEKWGKIDRETLKGKNKYRREMDERLKMNTIGLADLEKRVRDMEVYGEYVWSIEGWAAKSQSARDDSSNCIFSEPFYSHKNGYKMCLSIYSNGCEKSTCEKSDLFLSFHLMRGPFDNILSWPFQNEVTVCFVEQVTGVNFASDIITFAKLPNDACWKKPLTERNEGIFIDGMMNLDTFSSLCVDDKLFIRCIVNGISSV